MQDEIADAHPIKTFNDEECGQLKNIYPCDDGNIKENVRRTMYKNDGEFSIAGTIAQTTVKKSGFEPQIVETDVNTYCKLGHLHLLIYEFTEGKQTMLTFFANLFLIFGKARYFT